MNNLSSNFTVTRTTILSYLMNLSGLMPARLKSDLLMEFIPLILANFKRKLNYFLTQVNNGLVLIPPEHPFIFCSRLFFYLVRLCGTPGSYEDQIFKPKLDFYLPGQMISYKCFSTSSTGYVGVNNNVRQCQENGTWSGRAPICISGVVVMIKSIRLAGNVHKSPIIGRMIPITILKLHYFTAIKLFDALFAAVPYNGNFKIPAGCKDIFHWLLCVKNNLPFPEPSVDLNTTVTSNTN